MPGVASTTAHVSIWSGYALLSSRLRSAAISRRGQPEQKGRTSSYCDRRCSCDEVQGRRDLKAEPEGKCPMRDGLLALPLRSGGEPQAGARNGSGGLDRLAQVLQPQEHG